MHFFATFRAHELYNLEPYVELLDGPILDLGCGDGFIANELFQKQLDFGIDISEAVIEEAKKNDFYKEVFCTSAHNLPFEDNSIGGVFSNCVLEHIPNLDKVFSEVSRVLKPGGYFIASCNNNYYYSYDQAFNFLESINKKELLSTMVKKENELHNHVSVFNEEDYLKFLSNNSLHLEKCIYYSPKNIIKFVSLWDTLSKYKKKSKRDFIPLSFIESLLFLAYQRDLITNYNLNDLAGLNPLQILLFIFKYRNIFMDSELIKNVYKNSYEDDLNLLDELKPYEVLASLIKNKKAFKKEDKLQHNGFLANYLYEKFDKNNKDKYINFWHAKYKNIVYSKSEAPGLAQILIIKKV